MVRRVAHNRATAPIDPNHELKQWGPFLAVVVTSYVNMFANGGHLPTDGEGWSIFVANFLLMVLTGLGLKAGASTVPPPPAAKNGE